MTTNTEAAPIALAMKVGSMAVSCTNVLQAFSGICIELPAAVDAAGAVIIVMGLREPEVVASDPQADWLAQLQCRSRAGPLHHALRSGQPMITPDLTRVGPPELAAAAAECRLFTSVVVPLLQEKLRLGAVQLFGDVERLVGPEQVQTLRPLTEALSARLVDMLALKELARAIRQEPSVDVDVAAEDGPPTPPIPPSWRQSPQAWWQSAADERTLHDSVDDPADVPTDAIAVVPYVDVPSPRPTPPQSGRRYRDDAGTPESPERAEDDRTADWLPSDRSDAVGVVVDWFTARQPDTGDVGPVDRDGR
jgi:hypothetical protein